MTAPNADRQALDIDRHIHRISEAKQTFLFGSRARGDHRKDSDIDVLIITTDAPPDSWLEDMRQKARQVQKALAPEASGIDVMCMSEPDFLSRSRLRNNMTNTIIKEGYPIMPDENLGYRLEREDEEVDWENVEKKMADATGAANWIDAILQANILDAGDDKQFGRVAQNALEFAYKAVIAADGQDPPTGGRDGHNLTILTQLIRRHGIVSNNEEIPGGRQIYLTEFGGAAVYAHEHPALDRRLIAEDVPEAVARLREIVERASR